MAAIAVFGHFIAALFHVGNYDEANEGEAIRNLGLVVAAIFGAPFLVWRSIVLAKQTDIAAASLLNEKISSAADGLRTRREPSLRDQEADTPWGVLQWEDDIIARIVAIDQMYGVALESPSTSPRIVMLLAAYIRTNFPSEDVIPTEGLERARIPRMDLQKAVETIGELLPSARIIDPSNWRVDLSSCNFDGVDFSNRVYFAADFSKSRFEAANFYSANLEGAIISDCLLNFVNFTKANLKGVKFDRSRLTDDRGWGTSSLSFAELSGASFVAADLSVIEHIEPKKLKETFGTMDTKLSSRINSYRDFGPFSFSFVHDLAEFREFDSLSAEEADAVLKFRDGPFVNWSPYDSSDLATHHLRRELYSKISLDKWPYI